MKPHRPPIDRCDVLIVGGGVAGWAAAMGVIAAQAVPLLVERSERFGGKATNAMVGTICGAYLRSMEEKPRLALGNWSRFMPEMLVEFGGAPPERGEHGLWYQPYRLDLMEKFFLMPVGLVAQHSRLRTAVHEARAVNGGMEVRLNGPGGDRWLMARAAVDGTGNALLSQLCGGELIKEEQYQSPSQVVQLAGVPFASMQGIEATAHRALLRAQDKGDARAAGIKHIGLVHGSQRDGGAWLKVTLDHRVMQDDDPQVLNERGRSAALGAVQLLREGTDTFRSATVVAMAPELGVRTQQRPMGRQVLTEEHVLDCRKPADGVALGAWPIEHWGDGRGAEMRWMPEGEFYLIPTGALRSAAVDGLYFAGRCISATEMAIASARVMGTCISTGFAAGVLAAYHAMGREEQEAVDFLRKENLPQWFQA